LIESAAYVRADEKSARLDDEFTRQSAGQVALASQAQQCELRSTVWRDKLIATVGQRLSEHFKKVRPTWTAAENDAISRQIIYGAIYGAKSDVGAPSVDSTDIMKLGEQSLARSMACQVVSYRKSELP
jgi:hypothetical protein